MVKAVKGMKRGKGVGMDKIAADMILEGGEVLLGNLHALSGVLGGEVYPRRMDGGHSCSPTQ